MSLLGLSMFVTLFVLFIYLWLRRQQRYWRVRGIPSVPESLFFITRPQHFAFYIQEIYWRFKQRPANTPFIGLFTLFKPSALVLDLDLLKRIFVSDFDAFPGRGFYHNSVDDPLSGNLVRISGESWRRMRTKLTPTFSSSKMKYMCPTVLAVAERFAAVLQQLLSGAALDDSCSDQQLEMFDLCARYNTDVIGSVAFGIECNSLLEPHTEFREKGKKAFDCFNIIVEALGRNYAKLLRRLHVKVFTDELIEFYSRIVRENIAYRAAHHIRRNDFLDLLIELQQTAGLSVEDMIAQSFAFFIGGFETSSTTMTFCLYELAKHPEIQQRARDDVLHALAQHQQQWSYECLKDMNYLKMVIMESLRMHPVAPTLTRYASKDYTVPGTKHIIPAGVQVFIPVYAIHHDAAYYEAPEEFRPERFATIDERSPMTYLPFGAGPRACIAARFGKMQTLIGLAALLRNFKFTFGTRTPTTLEYDPKNLRIFHPKSGQLWLKVEKVHDASNKI